MATNKGDRWFFVYGFEKNERENISSSELLALKALAEDLLRLSTEQLNNGSMALVEIANVGKEKRDTFSG